MSILSGFFKTKKYRKTDTGYQLQSEWTSASTVEMADGNTAETNLGDIKGITDSLTATSSNVALSAKGGNSLQGQIDTLNNNLMYKTLDLDLSTEFQDTFNILDGHQNSFILGKLVVLDMMYNYNHKREDQFWDGKFSINVRLKHKITGIITSWNGTGYATMEIYPANDGSNKSICNVEGLGRLSIGYCQFHAIGVME